MQIKARLKCAYLFDFYEEKEAEVEAGKLSVGKALKLIDRSFNKEKPGRMLFIDGTEFPPGLFERIAAASAPTAFFGPQSICFGDRLIDFGDGEVVLTDDDAPNFSLNSKELKDDYEIAVEECRRTGAAMLHMQALLKCTFFFGLSKEIELDVDAEKMSGEEAIKLIDSRFDDDECRFFFHDGTEMPAEIHGQLYKWACADFYGAESVSFGEKFVSLASGGDDINSLEMCVSNFFEYEDLKGDFELAKAEECRRILEDESRGGQEEQEPSRQPPL